MKPWQNILVGEKTDLGLSRENNEDNFLTLVRSDVPTAPEGFGVLAAVADGMGGSAAGEVASHAACDMLKELFSQSKDESEQRDEHPTSEHFRAHLERIFLKIHENILALAAENRDFEGMGTTLSALLLHDGKAVVAHVGDSRIYRLRENELVRLTTDHTQVQALVEMGRLKPERAETHPARHVLTQAVGVPDGIEEVFLRIEDVRPEDVFLLCSDGLHDMVDEAALQWALEEEPIPQKACERLVSMALEEGGKDNITVLVVRTV